MFELSRPPVSALNTGVSRSGAIKGLVGVNIEIPTLNNSKHPALALKKPTHKASSADKKGS